MSSSADLAFLLRTVWPGRKRISVWVAALYWSMLVTTCSTVVRRVLAWVAVCCAIWALLPASIAWWSDWLLVVYRALGEGVAWSRSRAASTDTGQQPSFCCLLDGDATPGSLPLRP